MNIESAVNGIITGIIGTLIIGIALLFVLTTPDMPGYAKGVLTISLVAMDAMCWASPLLASRA
jgi:hypothetical protein